MKKILTLLFVVVLSQFTKAQTWCAPGAEWHYRVYVPMLHNYQDGYLKLQLAGTSTIGGIAYHTINMGFYGVQFTPNSTTVAASRGTINTYEHNNVVYASMFVPSNYDTIADFNANIGAKWRMTRDNPYSSFPNCPAVIPHVTVIDTGHVVINNQTLKTLLLSPSNSPTYTYTMIQKIGSINGFMFGYYTCLVDGWSTGSFVCYSDNNFALYKKPGYNQPCDFSLWGLVGKEETTYQNSSFNIYPNPTTDWIVLDAKNANNNKAFLVKITDLTGRELKIFKLNAETRLSTSELSDGIYLVSVFSETQQLLHQQKLVKAGW